MAGQRHPVLGAALWMAAALVSFILMAVSGRELAASFSTFQILFIRSVIGVALIGGLVWLTGWQQLRSHRLKAHLGRNIAHFAGQYGWFYGLGLISLAEVIALEFTTPGLDRLAGRHWCWVSGLTAPRWLALLFGIGGLLLILRPGAGVMHPAALAVLAGAMGYAAAYIFTKSLSGYRHAAVHSVLYDPDAVTHEPDSPQSVTRPAAMGDAAGRAVGMDGAGRGYRHGCALLHDQSLFSWPMPGWWCRWIFYGCR